MGPAASIATKPRLVGALIPALALLVALPAAAQEPRTHWGVQTGARQTLGSLQSRYGVGYVLGFESSYMPSYVGLAWSLQYTWFWSRADPRNVEPLQLIDLDFGVRARLPVARSFPLSIWAQAGVGLVRTSVPLEDAQNTSFIGPNFGLGVDLLTLAPFVFAVSADYIYLGGGPSGLRILAGIGISSR